MPAGKRLAPMLAEMVSILRHFGEVDIDDDTATLLAGMSAATIDRRLAGERRKADNPHQNGLNFGLGLVGGRGSGQRNNQVPRTRLKPGDPTWVRHTGADLARRCRVFHARVPAVGPGRSVTLGPG